jgi:hypothetical protein
MSFAEECTAARSTVSGVRIYLRSPTSELQALTPVLVIYILVSIQEVTDLD